MYLRINEYHYNLNAIGGIRILDDYPVKEIWIIGPDMKSTDKFRVTKNPETPWDITKQKYNDVVASIERLYLATYQVNQGGGMTINM